MIIIWFSIIASFLWLKFVIIQFLLWAHHFDSSTLHFSKPSFQIYWWNACSVLPDLMDNWLVLWCLDFIVLYCTWLYYIIFFIVFLHIKWMVVRSVDNSNFNTSPVNDLSLGTLLYNRTVNSWAPKNSFMMFISLNP